MVIYLVTLGMLIGVPYVAWIAWYTGRHHSPPPRGEVAIFYPLTLALGFAVLWLVWVYKFKKGAGDDTD
jgi:hypothetical protein